MLASKDRYKTAFATHNRLLEWLVMPQGCMNAARAYSRIIQRVFEGESPSTVTAFLDDVFLHTETFLKLLKTQQRAYNRIRANGVTFKREKVKLNHSRMKCLGHIVTNEGRYPDPKKIQAILDIRPPRSPTGVKQIVGLILYEKDYVAKLADKLAPLNDIMHDDADVVKDWTDAIHGKALRDIKQAFTSPPLLVLPDFSRVFRLWVDACTQGGRGIGAVLSQYYGDLKGVPYDPLGTDVSGDN